MKVTNFSKWTVEIFCILIIIISGITTLVLIQHYGVNIPFWDQWNLVFLLEEWTNQTLSINDLYRQHNEHRMPFPQLIMLILAFISNWNTKLEMYVSYVLATFSLTMLLIMLSALKLNTKEFALLAVLITGFMYSPTQAENWLWGWQIQWFLAVLTMLLSIYFIYQASLKKNSYLSILGATTCAFVSSYSLASGLLIWIIVLSAFVLYSNLRKNIFLWFIWLSGGVITYVTYLWAYTTPAHHPSMVGILKQPLLLIRYMGLYLNNSFMTKEIIGWAIILLFCLCCFFLLINLAVYRKLWPWFAIGIFALGNAFVTALGRAGLGVEQANSSRYNTISLLFLIATIVLLQQIIKIIFKSSLFKQSLFIIGFLALFGINLLGFYKGVFYMRGTHAHRLVIQECLSHYPLSSDDCLKKAFPHPQQLRQILGKAYALGFISLDNKEEDLINWHDIREGLIASSDKGFPFVEVRSDQSLFAHSPSKLRMPLVEANFRRLIVRFGIDNGAWQREGNTDGVNFTISLVTLSKEEIKIWSRLLQPKQIEADRGEQTASIDLPDQGGILIFETKPHGNTDWDWSYWSMVQFK